MNYSVYRLTDLSQLKPFENQMGEKQFYEYAIGIYKYFAKMEPGTKFDITKKVSKENIDKFIKIACLYFSDFPGQIIFNESFTQITKL